MTFRLFIFLFLFSASLPFRGSAAISPAEKQAIVSGLKRENRWGKIVAYQILILRVIGDYAYVDATPLDRDGKPLAEQQVGVLQHVMKNGHDFGWKEIDLSKVPLDPKEEMPGAGFQRNILKAYPFLPKAIFPDL